MLIKSHKSIKNNDMMKPKITGIVIEL